MTKSSRRLSGAWHRTLFSAWHQVVSVAVLATVAVSAQVPDRSKPPSLGPAPALKLPAVQKFTLGNGLRLWLLENHEVPLVQANLVVLSGAAADVPGQFGAASMTAAMLDEGAAGKAALALADEVEFLGAQLSTAASFDASVVRMSTPAAKLADALGLLAAWRSRPTSRSRSSTGCGPSG